MIVPILFKDFDNFPIPRRIPANARASGNAYPSAKTDNISNPQMVLPFTKEAARMIGNIGLQQVLKAVDIPPTVSPKIIADKYPVLIFVVLILIDGILKGRISIEYKPKKMQIKPAAMFQYNPNDVPTNFPAYPNRAPMAAIVITAPARNAIPLQNTVFGLSDTSADPE